MLLKQALHLFTEIRRFPGMMIMQLEIHNVAVTVVKPKQLYFLDPTCILQSARSSSGQIFSELK
jgi:hypothetical protein